MADEDNPLRLCFKTKITMDKWKEYIKFHKFDFIDSFMFFIELRTRGYKFDVIIENMFDEYE